MAEWVTPTDPVTGGSVYNPPVPQWEQDYEQQLRQRAAALMEGEGLPSIGDLTTQEIGRMPVEFSEANRAAMASFAANNMAGSGFQQGDVQQRRGEQASKTTQARQNAASKLREAKDKKTAEAYDLLERAANSQREREARVEEQRQYQRELENS